ncbi:hypothetical protein B5X24_HaOG209897 [Helicoverpa armigera]|uniref:Mitoferrin-1 n=1 Tax=Helicoverpa armigera TaxID=29058 RepID=A0A2W1BJ00_HELAM|nr:hypothetical protein B5X24_HaOG209897 [Helicoverpa armigera]
MSAVVLGAGPAHACYFATYEHCKHSLSHLTRHRHDHITHGESRSAPPTPPHARRRSPALCSVAGLSGCIASLIHDAVSNPAEGYHFEVVKQRMQMLNSPYRGVWECARHVFRTEGARAFYRSYGTQLAMNVPFQALHFVTYEACQKKLNPARAYDPLAHALSGAAGGALAAAATTPLDVCKTMPAAAICWLTYETFKHALAEESAPPRWPAPRCAWPPPTCRPAPRPRPRPWTR